MTRNEIRTAVIAHATPDQIEAYYTAQGLSRQSDMSKADWENLYNVHVNSLQTFEAVTEDQAPEDQAPEDQAPEDQAPAPAPIQTLDDIAPFVSNTVMDVFTGTLAVETARSEKLSHKLAETTAALDAMKAAPARVEYVNVPSDGSAPVPAKAPEHITQSTGKVNAGNVIPGRHNLAKRGLMIDVCDFPDCPPVDPDFMPPEDLPAILAGMACGLNILISGDAGTGKSSCVRWIAGLTKRPYFQIGFHAETSSADLFGFHGPEGDGMAWVPGDLLIAMQTPFAIVDLSEISFARPELVAQLFSVLETSDRTVFVGGQRYEVLPSVQFFATSNDNGTGEQSHTYIGTGPMNPALISRFGVRVEMKVPAKDRFAKMIARAANVSLDVASEIAEFNSEMEKAKRGSHVNNAPGVRACVSWAKMLATGISAYDAFGYCVLNSAPSDDANYWVERAQAGDVAARIDAAHNGAAPATDTAPEAMGETRSGFGVLEV